MKSTYKRNVTLNLFAALEIATGQVHAQTTDQKKRQDFRRFLDSVITELPSDKEIHVILDNYCTPLLSGYKSNRINRLRSVGGSISEIPV